MHNGQGDRQQSQQKNKNIDSYKNNHNNNGSASRVYTQKSIHTNANEGG
jgi:hypothetical protein